MHLGERISVSAFDIEWKTTHKGTIKVRMLLADPVLNFISLWSTFYSRFHCQFPWLQYAFFVQNTQNIYTSHHLLALPNRKQADRHSTSLSVWDFQLLSSHLIRANPWSIQENVGLVDLPRKTAVHKHFPFHSTPNQMCSWNSVIKLPKNRSKPTFTRCDN